ncbi:hypothetical protein NEISICOT_02549 [Neisseria sicca ATCC 29256]|uniref:Uncharacterized protein n=1 Tax=Neisseria sicca ATCC 29256 TaxID=547045 RepID=C6M7N7_NEISI|nr:hypothetical protein [Neisseria sicca]EET43611.1 hypothetical protein NEISICOT_02549 [Neisseria sicca ATCC 29256]
MVADKQAVIPALRAELKPLAWGVAEKIADCSHFVILLARTQAAMQAVIRRKSGGRAWDVV